ncbi:MAG: hypothetical protein ACU0DH_01090 [Paracoccus sp. (in: a-proteobacteria)]|uniref:hypothetical protein n=1 Tax=Paracoccus sp. TaxID=267 RepID=UPI002E839251|nr:hypothetical protein [Pseudomonadota bacterium]
MRSLAILLLLTPSPAAAFLARNGMEAARVGTTEIAVPFDSGKMDTDYWCAAGDFAQRALDLPVTTRLWRASPKPRGAGDGILFTLDQSNKAEGAGLSQFGAGPRDGSISIGQAVSAHCRIEIPLFNH